MSELVKEEKRRKKMEAVADDLFNNEKVSLILFPYPLERERERSGPYLILLSIYLNVLRVLF